jgi:hypothetical protein
MIEKARDAYDIVLFLKNKLELPINREKSGICKPEKKRKWYCHIKHFKKNDNVWNPGKV